MVYQSDKGSSESDDMGSQTSSTQQVKTCVDCGTTKTPLWRGGPSGPKSLCNACGIKSRKRRGVVLGLNTKDEEEKKVKKMSRKESGESTSTSADSTSMVGVCGDSLKGGKMFVFGRHVALQKPRSKTNSNFRRRFGEEEQAAFLLLALSRGCAYA